MVAEVLRELITDPDGIYLDATIGGGGHAETIMQRLSNKGRLVGLDRDPEAVARSARRLGRFGERIVVLHADYRNLAETFDRLGIAEINGALLDLGLSSHQLDDPQRGFSYRLGGPLDLRFDPTTGEATTVWLNTAGEEEIAAVIYQYGEERQSRRIAHRIVTRRESEPIQTASQLASIISGIIGKRGAAWGRTAARVFQALRIHGNAELDAIPRGLQACLDTLCDGARLVVISYHSLEDRIVKTMFREAARTCRCPKVYGRCICGAHPRGRQVYRHVLRPSADEIQANPRAAAARLRVFEKHSLPPEGSLS